VATAFAISVLQVPGGAVLHQLRGPQKGAQYSAAVLRQRVTQVGSGGGSGRLTRRPVWPACQNRGATTCTASTARSAAAIMTCLSVGSWCHGHSQSVPSTCGNATAPFRWSTCSDINATMLGQCAVHHLRFLLLQGCGEVCTFVGSPRGEPTNPVAGPTGLLCSTRFGCVRTNLADKGHSGAGIVNACRACMVRTTSPSAPLTPLSSFSSSTAWHMPSRRGRTAGTLPCSASEGRPRRGRSSPHARECTLALGLRQRRHAQLGSENAAQRDGDVCGLRRRRGDEHDARREPPKQRSEPWRGEALGRLGRGAASTEGGAMGGVQRGQGRSFMGRAEEEDGRGGRTGLHACTGGMFTSM